MVEQKSHDYAGLRVHLPEFNTFRMGDSTHSRLVRSAEIGYHRPMKRFICLLAPLLAALIPAWSGAATVPLNNPSITGTLTLGQTTTVGTIPWANIATGGTLTGITSIVSANSLGVTVTGGPLNVNMNVSGAPGLAGISGQLLMDLVSADSTQGRFILDSSDVPNSIIFRRTDGTIASPNSLLVGDVIVNLGAFGYTGAAYNTTARAAVQMTAGENWSSTANGTYLSFFTTPNTTVSPAEVVRIFGSGGVAIGNSIISTDPGAGGLSVAGPFSGSGAASFSGGIQSTPIGSITPSTGAFTTLTASGATTLTAGTASSSTTTGTLVVTGGVGVSGNEYLGGNLVGSGSITTTGNIQTNSGNLITTSGNLSIQGTSFLIGNVGIGGVSSVSASLAVSGMIPGNNGYGFYVGPTFTFSGNSQTSYDSDWAPTFATTNSGYTGLQGVNLILSTPIVTGTSGLADSYQLYISQGVAATNHYGIFQAGTDPNVLAGSLTLTPFSSAGVVINNSFGVLSSSAAYATGAQHVFEAGSGQTFTIAANTTGDAGTIVLPAWLTAYGAWGNTAGTIPFVRGIVTTTGANGTTTVNIRTAASGGGNALTASALTLSNTQNLPAGAAAANNDYETAGTLYVNVASNSCSVSQTFTVHFLLMPYL